MPWKYQCLRIVLNPIHSSGWCFTYLRIPQLVSEAAVRSLDQCTAVDAAAVRVAWTTRFQSCHSVLIHLVGLNVTAAYSVQIALDLLGPSFHWCRSLASIDHVNFSTQGFVIVDWGPLETWSNRSRLHISNCSSIAGHLLRMTSFRMLGRHP